MTHTKLLTILMASLFLLAVSLALRMRQLYVMSAALAAIPFISYLLGRYALRSLSCSRQAPEYASEGELLRLSLRIRGHSRLLGPIRVEDTLSEWLAPAEGGAPGSSGDTLEVGVVGAAAAVRASADGVAFSYGVVPTKRGEHLIGPVRVRATDPLGLFDFGAGYPLQSRILAFPTPVRLDEIRSAAGGEYGDYQFEGSGASGSGIDFHGVREYQPGDELRRVYWKSTARHGRLNVIEFEHSLAQDTVIAVELKKGTELGRGRYSSLEHGVRLAAGIAQDAVTGGSAVRLIGAGIEGPAAAAGKGQDQYYAVLQALALVEADREEALSDVLMRHADVISQNSVILCVTPEIDDRLAECAGGFRARHVRMTVLLVYMMPDRPRGLDGRVAELAAAGASVIVVACSPESPDAKVTYRYAA
ncbi:MAG: DUF58 domain-containing protein [Armatimonadetes bacterium]|nr:DUF58 domain-containing protein [Armatimonadota bacterium]